MFLEILVLYNRKPLKKIPGNGMIMITESTISRGETIMSEVTVNKNPGKESDLPIYLFKQGTNYEAYRYFGAHITTQGGEKGVVFRLWAPHAKAVSVVGDFNSWVPGSHPMQKVDDGIWE